MGSYRHAIKLFDSARKYFESAAEHIDSREWRFALVLIATAIELLAKAQVAFHDDKLLVRGKEVDDERFRRGEFLSIGMIEAFETLDEENLYGLTERHKNALHILRRYRNRSVHFSGENYWDDLRPIVASGLDVFLSLHIEKFSDEEEPYQAKRIVDVVFELRKFSEFLSHRNESLAPLLARHERPRTDWFIECAWCLQDAGINRDENILCLFCGDLQLIAERAKWVSEDRTVQQCTHCRKDAVSYIREARDRYQHRCIVCATYQSPGD